MHNQLINYYVQEHSLWTDARNVVKIDFETHLSALSSFETPQEFTHQDAASSSSSSIFEFARCT